MYKVVFISGNEVSNLEAILNGHADDGYSIVYVWENNNRLIVIMKYSPKPGRPAKEKNMLGE